MQTSYFSKYRGENAVSIAAITPKGFSGRVYSKLAPPKWLLFRYKKSGDESEYEKLYRQKVLAQLDAKTVYADLGENAVLLCWEGPDKFCHRHIVAAWFREQLGIEVRELESGEYRQMSLF